jgi:hypothetical protein
MVMNDVNKLWSTVGSAGTVNISDFNKIVFSNSIAQLGPSGASIVNTETKSAATASRIIIGTPEQALIRYPVTPVDGIFPPTPGYTLLLRSRPGEGYIVAKLIQVVIETGLETALVTWDSRFLASEVSFAPSDWIVTNFPEVFDGTVLDFVNNAYYVELTLAAVENTARPLTYPPAVSVIELLNGAVQPTAARSK